MLYLYYSEGIRPFSFEYTENPLGFLFTKEYDVATTTGIGFSQDMDPLNAAKEAAEKAKQSLSRPRIDLALIFHTAHYDPGRFLPTLFKTLDQTKVIGCSTAGIILPGRKETRGIGILAIHTESMKFETGHVGHLDLQEIRTAGRDLAKACISDFGGKDRNLFFVFPDGLLKNTSSLLDGVRDQMGDTLPIWGAKSSDSFHFEKTYQLFQNKFSNHGASAMLLGGLKNFGVSCKHGWRPLGKPRVVNKTEGPVIKSIDGKKAIHIYEEYFGEEAKTLKETRLGQINTHYPLGLRMGNPGEYLLRNVVSILDDGSIVCQDNVENNTEVHIMLGSKDSCLEAAEQAALEVKEQLKGKKPSVVLVFESLLRYKLLGRIASQEIQLIQNVFGSSTPIFGMHSYGEILTHLNQDKKITEISIQNGSIIILAFD